ncbi:hypothetical protein DV096_09355 [Bradymonadaceae bacterium TMQ3]|nr:hypothetical protein DV096_09355 [Bradymonadaceae bacterium TMQ3]
MAFQEGSAQVQIEVRARVSSKTSEMSRRTREVVAMGTSNVNRGDAPGGFHHDGDRVWRGPASRVA